VTNSGPVSPGAARAEILHCISAADLPFTDSDQFSRRMNVVEEQSPWI
jgi:hypothetical protein